MDLREAFEAGFEDALEKTAAFKDWLGEAHGTEAAQSALRRENYKRKGFWKGLLANAGDEYAQFGAALSGETPMLTHTTKRQKRTQKWLKERLAKKRARSKRKK